MPKVAIDISDADYKSITEDYISYADTESGRVYKAIKEGTVLPDNPTNGDMIEAVLAIKEIHAMAATIFVVLRDGQELEFNREWWFSSYKALTILKEPE